MADARIERQKVKEITDKLEEGLKELFESEKYKSYLSTMSKFHNYSFNNTLLIAMQKPEATLVAGYKAWQKDFNRHVNKGEKGIRILAPAPYKIKEERDKLDPVTGEVMLDQDGMPQKEEVEIKIPAFRAVSVFDVSQTDGEPIPELVAKELLSTVEGYEDFIKAVTYVAPAPIGFEDIPGGSKGYFSPAENRIAVHEGMGESQTLKTMLHETAHSMLHNKETENRDIPAQAKDRNTKEVEAESIAYTVCQHFGIDTSEYSFGYIAGWSSGKDMKELKSSLDTIRRTASELITGIEGQLKELQREKEASLPWEMTQGMPTNGQGKGSILLIQDSALSEYSLVSVRGMDTAEVVEALSAMGDADRLNVAAYLESRGAWTTEIANGTAGEFKEYRFDVRYNADTNEVIDMTAEAGKNKAEREVQLLHGDTDRYGIYQLKDDPGLRDFRFAGTAELLKRGILSDDFKEIQPENYGLVYTGELSDIKGEAQGEKLNAIFEKFNIDHPADYRGHSLSVSDIVVLHEEGENSAHFVDSFGFTKLPEFIRALADIKGQEAERAWEEERQDTSGHNVQKPEMEQAQTGQAEEQKSHPPVYWNPLSYATGHGEVREYRASRTLDRECKEAIEKAIRQNFDGMHLKHDIVKPLVGQYGPERITFVLANTLQQGLWDGRFSRDNKAWASEFRIPEDIIHGMDMNYDLIVDSHPAVLDGFIGMFRREALEQEKEVPTEQEELTSGHDAQKPQTEQPGAETELAFRIADRYISIQETEGGYDYSIMDLDYKEIDGGVYDNANASIREALSGIIEGLKENLSGNGTRGDIDGREELIPIDYDGLMEKVEEANRIREERRGVREAGEEKESISIFNIRMNGEERCFRNTSGLDAEGLCKAYAECSRPFMEMGEYGEELEAADFAHIEQGDRLDFSIEFNEETGQITIFDGVNFEYKGLGETLYPKLAEVEVTLTVAECGEFHSLGEFHGNVPTVDEAIAIWKQIPPERMNGIPAIGINLHTPGTEAYEDVGADILTGRCIDLDVLEYSPEIKGNPQAMEVVAELVAKLPEMEIDGRMSEEFEAKVWEKRMPGLTPAERLAVEIDRLAYDYDTAFYRDNSQGMTVNVSELAEALNQRDTHGIALWLADVVTEGTKPEETKRAMKILKKLTEYKPLAKVEEMEEQNYNMVDNVLNNGAGERAQKEENKRGQERPAARDSLKARLAEKKALVSGQGKDHDAQKSIKSSQREM